GGMVGADIGVGWVDNRGTVHFQDRHALNTSRPIIDNTTNDWIALQGKEVNGWTAIQFKRLLDTCDSMDVSIKYLLPPIDLIYYCKVFKIPERFSTKRHAIGYQILVESNNLDIVHHMNTYECDSRVTFDDSNLPEGECDDAVDALDKCRSNVANGWGVGGDQMVEYPPEAGYPVGGDFSNKYYMVEIHFDNRKIASSVKNLC
ncbi:unnamed protein product, partial [Rotaria sordida]